MSPQHSVLPEDIRVDGSEVDAEDVIMEAVEYIGSLKGHHSHTTSNELIKPPHNSLLTIPKSPGS